MKKVYQLKIVIGFEPEFYSSIDGACRRMNRHPFVKDELKPFHTDVKKAIKENGVFKNSAFELTKHNVA